MTVCLMVPTIHPFSGIHMTQKETVVSLRIETLSSPSIHTSSIMDTQCFNGVSYSETHSFLLYMHVGVV